MVRDNPCFLIQKWALAKMQAAGDVLKPVAVDLCCYIDQKIFNDAIVSLGLLSESDLLQRSGDDDDDVSTTSSSSSSSSSWSSSTLSSFSSSSNSTKVCFS